MFLGLFVGLHTVVYIDEVMVLFDSHSTHTVEGLSNFATVQYMVWLKAIRPYKNSHQNGIHSCVCTIICVNVRVDKLTLLINH